jgi:predicted AAA+ superfamily ATPase
LKRYLDILQALFIVFTVQPWHHNIARAILQSPKVYFFDTGLVRGDESIRLENAVAGMLLKHVNFLQDSTGKQVGLHYIRTKDGTEVDFAVSEEGKVVRMIECKWGDSKPHRGLMRFAEQFAEAESVQIVYGLRHEELRNNIKIIDAASWLMGLAA